MTITVKNLKISRGFRPVKKDANLAKLIGEFETSEPFDAVREHDDLVSGEH